MMAERLEAGVAMLLPKNCSVRVLAIARVQEEVANSAKSSVYQVGATPVTSS